MLPDDYGRVEPDRRRRLALVHQGGDVDGGRLFGRLAAGQGTPVVLLRAAL